MSLTYSVILGEGITADDITADVLEMHWRRGFRDTDDHLATPAELKITVNNRDLNYSPEHGGGVDLSPNLSPNRPVTVTASDGVSTWTLFTGFVHHVAPQTGTWGERQAVIVARDALATLQEVLVRLPLQMLIRADDVIEDILDTAPLDTFGRSVETGVSVLAYVGDLWGDGVSAWEAIRTIIEAERGYVYCDRDGVLVMRNRHHLLKPQTAALTLTDTAEAMAYTFGAGLVNRVRIRVRPREIGAAGSDVWVLDSPQMLRPDAEGERVMTVRFRDANGFPVGAFNVLTPLKITDYSANTQADGGGTDVTASVDMTLLSAEASSAQVKLRNNSGDTAYLLAGARLRGTPISRGDDVTVEQSDAASMAAYGVRGLTLKLFTLDSVEDADQAARFELARRKDPRGDVESITLNATLAGTLSLSLLDCIHISEGQSGTAGDYHIMAEEHHITQGGAVHRITWTLMGSAASSGAYWALNVSVLDSTTRLAY